MRSFLLISVTLSLPGWASAAERCPIYWDPGDPVALYPHNAAAVESPSALLDVTGQVASRAARSWIEVGRPEVALMWLESVSADAPAARVYRLAALAALSRWAEYEDLLAATPSGFLPDGCVPLIERWSAYGAMASGDPIRADRAFDRLVAAAPGLGAYVDLWRLEAAAESGDLARGRGAWAAVVEADLPRPAHDHGRVLLALLYERAGELEQARELQIALADEARGLQRGQRWLTVAELEDRIGDRAAADKTRRRVVAETPAVASGIVLDPVQRERLGISAVEAALVLLAAGRPGEAERFATAAIDDDLDEASSSAAFLARARARAATADRAGAEADYAEFLSRWPNDPRAPDAQYSRARLAVAARDGETARRRLENFVARFPSHRQVAAARYLIADSYQDDRGVDPSYGDRAIEYFDQVTRENGRSFYADRAYMRAAHLAFALGRYTEAADRYAAYRGRRSVREARYWLARAMEAQGDTDSAETILRTLASQQPADYYALLAGARLAGSSWLGRLGPDHRALGPTRAQVIEASLADSAGQTAAALLALGEWRYARAELERALARRRGNPSELAQWAEEMGSWGFPDLTLRAGVWLGERAAGERYAFPRGFASSVDNEASAHGIDAYLMLALIRQESLFRADAESDAGARGLMQIIPATGEEIATATGWPEFDPSILDRPAVNLHFGTHYLERQIDRFEGFIPAVLAAYNGGPHNVEVWWWYPERTLDPELWIDRIPFRETRNYVKRVIVHYALYRSLYDDSAASR
ncbi:MAG: transglycosylase SLT domain-containing protein [Gemmatimonadota bacterium]